MRTTLALLLAGLCALAIAVPSYETHKYKVADKTFLERQKDILRLFKYVTQPNGFKDQVDIATNYKIKEHFNDYRNVTAVKEFLQYYEEDMLPQGEVFSIFYETHREQAIALFNVFYYAKDFETFYKTAVWARDHVNEGMFVYALNIAVLHRPDTKGFVLPPIYEIYPYYFFNSEVLHEAHEYKMTYGGFHTPSNYIIKANYSGWYKHYNKEQKLAYFTEDIGLNAYYYYYHADYPFWMGGEEFGLKNDKRGELYYYVHQQLLARYYLERLSNDMGLIGYFDWEEPFTTPYYPTMRYHNGLQFPVRPGNTEFQYPTDKYDYTYDSEDKYWTVQEIQDYERRIRDAIDRGFIYTPEGTKVNIYDVHGFDLLGRLIESNPDSPNTRFYGDLQIFARQVLGYSPYPIDDYKVVPSALEHFETALRDPAFYQFYKRITFYFLKYKDNLPHYTYDDLFFPGVKVEDVEVDKFVTYFDHFDVDVTNALYVKEEEFEVNPYYVQARQYRLNHKPYTYKINVRSDKDSQVVVRIFLGPKYNEYGHELDINDNRYNFVEMDQFVWEIKSGKNVIERSSRDAETVKDRTSYRHLYEKVMSALRGGEEFRLDMSEAHCGFPDRLVLPKGKVGGQVFQLYVMISPYKPMQKQRSYEEYYYSCGVGSGSRYVDTYPLGYPFDREIDESYFYVPNSFFKDVVIYHREEVPTTYTTGYSTGYKADYKPEYKPEYKSDYKPDYETGYKTGYKTGYPTGYPTTYGNTGVHY